MGTVGSDPEPVPSTCQRDSAGSCRAAGGPALEGPSPWARVRLEAGHLAMCLRAKIRSPGGACRTDQQGRRRTLSASSRDGRPSPVQTTLRPFQSSRCTRGHRHPDRHNAPGDARREWVPPGNTGRPTRSKSTNSPPRRRRPHAEFPAMRASRDAPLMLRRWATDSRSRRLTWAQTYRSGRTYTLPRRQLWQPHEGREGAHL
jgi:hypothetical protein